MASGENNYVSEIYRKIQPEEKRCAKFISDLEAVARCRREQFSQDSFNKPNITKATISSLLYSCHNIISTKSDHIKQLCHVIDTLVQDSNQLKEENSCIG